MKLSDKEIHTANFPLDSRRISRNCALGATTRLTIENFTRHDRFGNVNSQSVSTLVQVDSWNLSFRSRSFRISIFPPKLLNLVWESCHHNFRQASKFLVRSSFISVEKVNDGSFRPSMYVYPSCFVKPWSCFSNTLRFFSWILLKFRSSVTRRKRKCKNIWKIGRNIWENSISNSTLVWPDTRKKKKDKFSNPIELSSSMIYLYVLFERLKFVQD